MIKTIFFSFFNVPKFSRPSRALMFDPIRNLPWLHDVTHTNMLCTHSYNPLLLFRSKNVSVQIAHYLSLKPLQSVFIDATITADK